MKITYLLGAGASYNSIPIIGELNNAFIDVNNLCKNDQLVKQNVKLNRAKGIFDSHMATGAKAAKLFGTVDTYSKKLSLTNEEDLIQFKAALSLFFTIWQEIDKKFLPMSRNNEYYDNLDNRYSGLLANFLDKYEGKIILNSNVNFLTWNYDTQLERALSLFTDFSLEKVLQEFKVYPFNSELGSRVIHLNGIAGIYQDVYDNKLKTLFNNKEYRNHSELFENILDFISNSEDRQITNNELFTYAWENDPISIKALLHAENILKDTNVLVVIGYSFPTFNDSVDKRLFNVLKNSSKFHKVYYQDPNASVELLNARFDIDTSKIKVVNDVEQFILPLESQIIRQSNTSFKRVLGTYPDNKRKNLGY